MRLQTFRHKSKLSSSCWKWVGANRKLQSLYLILGYNIQDSAYWAQSPPALSAALPSPLQAQASHSTQSVQLLLTNKIAITCTDGWWQTLYPGIWTRPNDPAREPLSSLSHGLRGSARMDTLVSEAEPQVAWTPAPPAGPQLSRRWGKIYLQQSRVREAAAGGGPRRAWIHSKAQTAKDEDVSSHPKGLSPHPGQIWGYLQLGKQSPKLSVSVSYSGLFCCW